MGLNSSPSRGKKENKKNKNMTCILQRVRGCLYDINSPGVWGGELLGEAHCFFGRVGVRNPMSSFAFPKAAARASLG